MSFVNSKTTARRAPKGALLALGFLTSLLVATAAAGAVALAISPQLLELLVSPGAELADVVSYTNTGTETVSVSVQLVDFVIDGDGKVMEIPPATDASTLVPYVKISPLRLTVSPGQKVYFRYAIKAPQRFTHVRTMVYFVARPVQKQSKRAAAVFVPRIGIPIYLENRHAKPALLRVGDVKWQRDAKGVVLHVPITNEGERLYRPGGFIQVRSASGTKNVAFNESGNPVLPGQNRRFTVPLTEVGGGELSLQVRVTTSPRAVFNREYRVAAGETSSPSSR
jgi:hypothetical protein